MSNSAKPDFEGSGLLFLKNVFLYVLVMAPLVSVCLMGEKWAYIFFSVMVVSLPFFLLVGVFVSRFDRFSFDDENARIVKTRKRTIPYQTMKRVDINITGRLMQVSIKQGLLRRTALASALDIQDKPRLVEELLKRLPQVVVRERRFVDWKSIALIMAVIAVLTAGFHLYLYHQYSALGALPNLVEWKSTGKKLKSTQAYDLGQFVVVMPKRFAITGQDEGGLQFADKEAKMNVDFIIKPQKNLFDQHAALLGYATGIHTYTEVLETGYHARIGIVPLMIKLFALTNLADVKIYEIKQPLTEVAAEQRKEDHVPLFKGFATQGKKKDQEVVTIVLTETKRKADIYIFISAPKRLQEKKVREIVAGISLRPIPL
jgi:hypothetical protein